MLNWRKIVFSGVLISTLSFSGLSASAVSFDDVGGLQSEAAISKLVSLGIIVNSGSSYNPDDALKRLEFAEIANKIMTLHASSSFKIKDIDTTKGKNKAVNKIIKTGILKVNKNNEFKPNNAITYAEFSKALAYGLGFKPSWSDRPIDYFFFLERKGVLEIDTDLDASVTREAAAVAIDKYMAAKRGYETETGVVVSLENNKLTIKKDTGLETYTIASNVSLFLDEQATNTNGFATGTEVNVVLNSKGQVAFASGVGIDMVDGVLGYTAGKVKVGSSLKNMNLNAVVSSLPNSRDIEFTFTEFSNYVAKANVTFNGTLYTNLVNDEVMVLEAFISKVEGYQPVKLENDKVTVDFSAFALKNQTFSFDGEVKFSIVEGEKITEVKLEDLIKLQTEGKVLVGNLEAAADGSVTVLTVKATNPQK